MVRHHFGAHATENSYGVGEGRSGCALLSICSRSMGMYPGFGVRRTFSNFSMFMVLITLHKLSVQWGKLFKKHLTI